MTTEPLTSHVVDVVVGVDTHAATHTLAVVTATTAALEDTRTFPTNTAGLKRALAWIQRRVGARTVLIVVEGIGTYGATIATACTAAGLEVVEAARMGSGDRKSKGKNDDRDAARIAASVLGLPTNQLRRPRAEEGPRQALRVLRSARELLTTQRTSYVNALNALVRSVDLGVDTRKALTAVQILDISTWRRRSSEPEWLATCRGQAAAMAKTILTLDAQLKANHQAMAVIVAVMAPQLMGITGIGAAHAASVLAAWSHPGRVRSEAAFAALAGVNPIPASSGKTTRYRLNRGGDRSLNKALHLAVIVRLRFDDETRAYMERRTREGKTKAEVIRLLKRYLARRVYRALAQPATGTATRLPIAA